MNQQRPSETTEHYSPAWISDIARGLMGGRIDTDPASSEKANTIIQAGTIHTELTDGLSQSWLGKTFCNPPGQPSKWFKKGVEEYLNGNCRELFFVVYSIDRLPTILKVCKNNGLKPLVIIPHQRVEYLNCETLEPQTQPLHGSAFVILPSKEKADGWIYFHREVVESKELSILRYV